jgi:feruloyl esterase
VRLFMVPGMGHCGGGPGTDRFDALSALEAWVEKGVAPDIMVAQGQRAQGGVRTRPLCAFPKVARYRGRGDSDDARSYECK